MTFYCHIDSLQHMRMVRCSRHHFGGQISFRHWILHILPSQPSWLDLVNSWHWSCFFLLSLPVLDIRKWKNNVQTRKYAPIWTVSKLFYQVIWDIPRTNDQLSKLSWAPVTSILYYSVKYDKRPMSDQFHEFNS